MKGTDGLARKRGRLMRGVLISLARGRRHKAGASAIGRRRRRRWSRVSHRHEAGCGVWRSQVRATRFSASQMNTTPARSKLTVPRHLHRGLPPRMIGAMEPSARSRRGRRRRPSHHGVGASLGRRGRSSPSAEVAAAAASARSWLGCCWAVVGHGRLVHK